jgi:competence protein ComFC
MRLFNTILDIIFPIRCISCKKRGTYVCTNCLENCRPCERENLDWIYSIYDYRDPLIKKAIWFLKYKGKKNLAKTFALQIYDKTMEDLSELSIIDNFKNPILIPIPLSKKRQRERGFNQSELLCRELMSLSPSSFTLEKNILRKQKDTFHQARIKDKHTRLKNIIGSFYTTNNQQIKNKNIILIDDVTTTGATLSEARKVLKQAGAKKVIAFTIAH